MRLENIKIGLGITGSFCNFSEVKNMIESLKAEGATIIPIVSYSTKELNTRFFEANKFIEMLETTTNQNVVDTIVKAEPVGPKNMIDIMVICPCTGNSLSKLSNGITDTPVLMATKGHIRNNKPVVIGVSTNDGLGASGVNILNLLNTKNFYFIPFKQDDYKEKPKSLVLDYTYFVDTIVMALDNKQIQPVISRS